MCLEECPEFIYVFLEPGFVYFLPKEAFGTTGQLEEFRTYFEEST